MTPRVHGAALTAWLPRQLSPATVDIYMAAPAFQSTAREREPVYGTAYSLRAVDDVCRAAMPAHVAFVCPSARIGFMCALCEAVGRET